MKYRKSKAPRALLSTLIAVAIVASLPVSPAIGADEVDDNQVPILNMAGAGDLHIFADESYTMTTADAPSMLALGTEDNTEFCANADSGVCAGRDNLWFYAHLPVCDAMTTIDCIVGVSATTSSGTLSTGSFENYFPDAAPTMYPGKPSMKLPSGRAPSVWSIPGAPHVDGTDYAVSVRLDGGTNDRSKAVVQVVLTAVTLKPDADTSESYTMPKWIVPGRQAGPVTDRGRYKCSYWGENGACLLTRPFPAGMKYTVQVRLAEEPSGWLHGRVSDPSVTFDKLADGVELTVTAAPVQVPAFRVARKHTEFPTEIQRDFGPNGKFGFGGSRSPGGMELIDLTKRNAEYNVVSYRQQSFEQLEAVTELINDTAAYAPWVWSIRTLTTQELWNASPCITKGAGVKGIVSTNATVYGSGPPQLSADGTTLNYRVASPHFTRTGDVFKGNYVLAIRNDVADCLYGMSDDSATDTSAYHEESSYVDTTYVDDDGLAVDDSSDVYLDEEPLTEEEVTVAELLAEDRAPSSNNPTDEVSVTQSKFTNQLKGGVDTTVHELDGWTYFSATNITFSSPEVGVQMAKVPVRAVLCARGETLVKVTVRNQTCPPGTMTAKIKHCVKGKRLVLVASVSPRCPKGTMTASALVCARKAVARKVIDVKPVCPKGFSKVSTIHCVRGKTARTLTAVSPRCANGFMKATLLTCKKVRSIRKVLGTKPRCPSGYKPTSG